MKPTAFDEILSKTTPHGPDVRGAMNTVSRELRAARDSARPVRLAKATSNLFRQRRSFDGCRIDVSAFDRVFHIDDGQNFADVGGATPYDRLVDETLKADRMPAVVPELKSITVGGAVTGGGIESSSFRYGFVHESVLEMEILTASGDVLLCRPDNEYADLFYGFANSYGTLGYALRLRIELVPVRPFVRLHHKRFTRVEALYESLEAVCRSGRAETDGTAFVDGTVFDGAECYQSVGRWSESESDPGDYTFMRAYYRSIRERSEDALKVKDYIWRWDTDWFWCARAFGMDHPVVRFLFGLSGNLNSRTYAKLRRLYLNSPFLQRILPGNEPGWVIQDVQIPVEQAAAFQHFLLQKIGLRPIWICPAMAYRDSAVYPLFETDPQKLYINFGFWGGVESPRRADYCNRLIEEMVTALGGKKSLYSDSCFREEEFWSHYNEPAYRALKRRYDPDGFFPDLYEKCVRRV